MYFLLCYSKLVGSELTVDAVFPEVFETFN